MQDRTIDNALLALRRQGGEVQELADRLLNLRGIETAHIRAYCTNRMGKRQMRKAILEALQDGPKTGPGIVRHVMQYLPGMTFTQARGRVSTAMTKMKDKGLVQNKLRKWCALPCQPEIER